MAEQKHGAIGFEVGEKNRERVWAHFHQNPFDNQKQCAEALGLSVMAVSRAVKAIRDGWTPQYGLADE